MPNVCQPKGAKSDGKKRQVIIGLDFGTAFTKVVIGDGREHLAVPLPKPPGDSLYLLASSIVSDAQGDCELSHVAVPGCRLFSNLKLPLLEDSGTEGDRAAAVAFLALVLRHARRWFVDQKGEVYRGTWIDWLLNLGVATETYHRDERVQLFHRLASAAWVASVLPGRVNLALCQKCLELAGKEGSGLPAEAGELADHVLHADCIAVVPEFVAQIAGYTRSPRHQDDLHMLIDIGAGTLDVAMFNIYGDRLPIFAKAVHPLGTQQLIRHRHTLDEHVVADESLTPFLPVPSTREFAKLLQVSKRALVEHDRPFCGEVRSAVYSQIQYVHTKRYRRSRRWSEGGVPVFVCGGGSQVDVYKLVFDKLFSGLQTTTMKCRGYAPPPLDGFKAPGLPDHQEHRLSVAYGLSFDPFDLGEIVRVNQVEDDKEDVDTDGYRDNYVGPELL